MNLNQRSTLPRRAYAVLIRVSPGYPPPKGRFPRVTHPSAARQHPEGPAAARLACVRHAASVRSEPGSNSQVQVKPHPKPRSRNHEAQSRATSESLTLTSVSFLRRDNARDSKTQIDLSNAAARASLHELVLSTCPTAKPATKVASSPANRDGHANQKPQGPVCRTVPAPPEESAAYTRGADGRQRGKFTPRRIIFVRRPQPPDFRRFRRSAGPCPS